MMTATALTLTLLGTTSIGAWAYDTQATVSGHDLPAELKDVGVEEKLGNQLDLGLTFTDQFGHTVPLGSFFRKDRPVLMAMVYYDCPSLCNYHLNGLVEAMKALKWTAGNEFDVVAVSMNSREESPLAMAKLENYLQAYGRPDSRTGWHFLVGTEANVKALADQFGFRFQWMPDKQQFAHAAVTYVVTPEGKISRYLHGIQPDPTTLRMSLLEASNGKIGSVIEQVLMFCFQFNPTKNKYTLYAWNLMRIGAIVMVLLLAVLLVPLWRDQWFKRTRT